MDANASEDNKPDSGTTTSDDALLNDPLLSAQYEADDDETGAEKSAKSGDAEVTITDNKADTAEGVDDDQGNVAGDHDDDAGKGDEGKGSVDDAGEGEGDSKAEDKPEANKDDDVLADLPEEDWDNLSHKAKSQFLSQRKKIRKMNEDIKAAQEQSEKAQKGLTTINKFVQELGIDSEDYTSGLALVSAVKKNDPRAIPIIEQTLADLREATGQQAQPQQPAGITMTPELKAAIEEAEELGIEINKYLPQQEQQQQQQKSDADSNQNNNNQQTNNDQAAALRDQEVEKTCNILANDGIPDAEMGSYVQSLVANELQGNVPTTENMVEKISIAHMSRMRSQAQQSQQKQPENQGKPKPVSSRGAPRQKQQEPSSDPLKNAIA